MPESRTCSYVSKAELKTALEYLKRSEEQRMSVIVLFRGLTPHPLVDGHFLFL